jgi:phosphoglycolate phosphatase-like HAD superfamily hydrolase
VTAERLVLFDIDATLLLTAGAGRRAITAALAEEVADISGFHQVHFDGKTDPQIISELLHVAGYAPPHDQERVEALCRRYVSLLETELGGTAPGTVLMPGIRELLARLLDDQTLVLGLLTGNLVDGAVLKLRSAGLDPASFKVGAYGSDSAHRPDLPGIAAGRARPFFGGRAPSGHAVVIVGDTPSDIGCGAEIGARAIAVATGRWSRADLLACHPYAAFEDLSDTDAVVRAIVE